ncbi:hypothetical protein BCY91_07415 [Pelobium manganitolerans]|uniref:Cadherin-like domain-containing protein n=1 Tax=Pelobium manganitolerans TaxID=1842495 RepID=A0A419S3S9_9SPHI|nr:gliding motility-associated C-terminal domain-containing protein [Pelobium manganitolerans]RKD14307.1 hypothetical protein BCY91_07415 [Pelobium manganitolerans]
MKIHFTLKKGVFCAFMLALQTASAQNLPYFQSFKETTANKIEFGGTPTAFLTAAQGIDPPGQGYLRLTGIGNNEKGFIYSKENFNTSQGLSISFEYFVYGGSGADGICFFLFDGSTTNFNIGGFGGSLGYAQWHPLYTSTPLLPGVSNGYLGVGIDEYGNFSNPVEGRQGGITGPDLFGTTKKSVTLRGKGNGDALTANNYRYLTSVRAEDKGVDLVRYDLPQRFPDSTELAYRKAYIDLKPAPGSGYYITVRIKEGGTPTKTTTLIEDFLYSDTPPANIAYGISSSTGDQTNFHEIRNVSIDIYRRPLTAASAVDDVVNECLTKTSTWDVLANDASTNPGGILVKTSLDLDPSTPGEQKSKSVAGKGTFTANIDGTITFTPANGDVTGSASVKYLVTDDKGAVSNVATLTINAPVNTIPANAGADQTIHIATQTGTFNLSGNGPAGYTGLWTQKSGPSSATLTNATLANATATNLALGTYVFTWTLNLAGQCAVSDDVTVLVNAIPVAVPDDAVGKVNTSTNINVLVNDTDRDGNATIDKTTVTIKTQPAHGSLAVDPVTGVVTYTPTTAGPDSFTYTVKDNHGAESTPALVNIAVPQPAKIGLAKAFISADEQADESYNAKFVFTISNFSNVALQNVSLTDDLTTTFGATPFTIVSLTSTDGLLTTNAAYNGSSIIELLAPNNQLAASATAKIELVVNVKLSTGVFNFQNVAFAEGTSVLDGTVTQDQSTDGLKPDPTTPEDVSPKDPTPVTFKVDKIFIPEGFSPNGDGEHDTFVINNGGLTPLVLEIYNRWGNVVYKSNNYVNDWDGRSNKGLSIGSDLPVGTYYYIVNYNGKKYVGFITLNR